MPKSAMQQGNWKLKSGVAIDPKTAEEIAKIACALKSVSMYAGLAFEEDNREAQELRAVVQEGLDAIDKVFEW